MATTTAPVTAQAERRALDPARRNRYRGLLAGLLGALPMVALFLRLRPTTSGGSVLDTLADATLLAMPISVFAFFLEQFGAQAKTLFLIGLILLLLLVGAGLGQRHAVATAGGRRVLWGKVQGHAIGLTIVLAVLVLGLSSIQTPDAVLGNDVAWTALAIAGGVVAWALTMAFALWAMRRGDTVPGAARSADEPALSGADIMDRRRAIAVGATGAVAIGAAAVVGRDVYRVAARPTVGTGSVGEIPPAITPVGEFYTISKNFIDPSPARGENWEFTVDGLVDTPGTVTRADLEALGPREFVSTLTCISNPIGGELIGTARWTGVPLADVLRPFGVRPTARDLVAYGEDGYSDSFPVTRALAPEPHIVWAMNDEPLIERHGMPVRLIVPGLYGIKNVKWLTRLSFTADDYQGYWQERDWTDTAIIKTQSHFDVPRPRDVLVAGPQTIGGIAFAGDRGISAVEVSLDDGETWRAAEITANPSPAGLSWVIWTMAWSPTSGTYHLAVRATDGEGTVQTEEGAPTLPDGASGYHRVTVGVA